jgi:hypothetical protein
MHPISLPIHFVNNQKKDKRKIKEREKKRDEGRIRILCKNK